MKEYAGSIEDNAVQLGLEAVDGDKYVMEGYCCNCGLFDRKYK